MSTPLPPPVALVDSLTPVPFWLQGCWRRAYIKQSFRPPRQIDEDNLVRYVQGPRLCLDMRLLKNRGKEGGRTDGTDGSGTDRKYLKKSENF